ncbi:BTAD domain-containing putative transcriptional regulator [Kitasatospora sp. NPDC090091]|uniref:AfsR/SARP family transcriptional regulator n=1 Tax=Kitasatospora sp. NPDC090091 TaxID=3364081 RepID=UPI0037F8ACF1
MFFRVLGELGVEDNAGQRAVRGVRLRSLLALLLLHPNQPLTTDRLQDALWAGGPPESGAAAVHNLVARLRRALADGAPDRIAATQLGYRLRVADDELDSLLFEGHLDAAHSAVLGGDWESVHRGTSAALALWRGAPLAELPELADAGPARERWQEARLQALEWRLDADLRLGRSAGLVPELARLVDEHPLREAFHQQLMLALHRTGRRAQALAAYRRLRRTLRDELGIEPGHAAQRIHQDILRATEPGTEPTPPAPAASWPTQLGQLPADTSDFTGRDEELGQLRDHLAAAARGSNSPSVLVISGMGGVGKTALAVRTAHRAKELFPDGQLYVDLRGFGNSEPREPHEVLARFLSDLGALQHGSSPAKDTHDRAAQLRAALTTRRVLLLLDNARDAQHLLPLLPGDGRSAVLATSRNTLTDLPGAVQIRLEPLDVEDQRRLLSAVCGTDRVSAEPDSALRLLATCGGLPLALRVVAARLTARPAWSLDTLAQRLSVDGQRLRSLAAGHLSVRDTFASSYLALRDSEDAEEREAARLFRLLGLWPGMWFGVEQTAALVQRPTTDVANLLELLVDYHLLQSPEPWRYRFHDLLGEYAADRVLAEEPDEDRTAALLNLLTWYTAAGTRAYDVLNPRSPLPAIPEDVPSPLPAFSDEADALAWFIREIPAYRDAVRLSVRMDRPDLAWRTACLLGCYGQNYWSTGQWMGALNDALDATRESGDRIGLAHLHNNMGIAHAFEGRMELSLEHLREALGHAEAAGQTGSVARLLFNLAAAATEAGDVEAGLGYARRFTEKARITPGPEAAEAGLLVVGRVLMIAGELEEAEQVLREALDLWRRLGVRSKQAIALKNLGEVLDRLGRPREALAVLSEGLEIRRALGIHGGVVTILQAIARTEAAHGDPEIARRHWREALDVAREHRLDARIQEIERESNGPEFVADSA